MVMRSETVGARELKTRLGTYIRKVRQGLTLVVTERGEPVAELRPLDREGSSERVRLEELAALGMVTRTSRRRLPRFRRLRSAGRPASEAVVEDREDRF